MSDDERLTERFEQIERNRTYEEAKEPEEDGICKRCKNERKSATEGNDYLCDGCFDFLNGVSPYDPMTPNPMLEAVQAMLDDDDPEDYEDPEDYDDYWDD